MLEFCMIGVLWITAMNRSLISLLNIQCLHLDTILVIFIFVAFYLQNKVLLITEVVFVCVKKHVVPSWKNTRMHFPFKSLNYFFF